MESSKNMSGAPEERHSTPGTKRRRHNKHRKKKKPVLKSTLRWIKKNPLKIIAVGFLAVIVYLSVLFYNYDEEVLISEDNITNDKVVKGILLPMRILSEISTVSLSFGSYKETVSLKELQQGYELSAAKLVKCGNGPALNDSTRFTIYLVQDRLYVTAIFKEVYSDKIVGVVDKKDWIFLSENLSDIRTDDYSFGILDSRKNVLFSMQFLEPDTLAIHGYFIGKACVYVVKGNEIYAGEKTGNYIERVLPEIKQIPTLW